MKKSADSLRKSPKQGRSRELVEAIYQATVRILPQIGPENLTTKKIAEVAGVSIGSLYQYFPNKQSVLGAVMDASAHIINTTLARRFNELPNMSLDDAIQFSVDGALEVFLNEREQVREVFRPANELGRLPAIMAFRRVSVDRLSRELQRRYPHIPLKDCERITFVAVNSLVGVAFTMLYDETQTWTREELARELGVMFKVYLKQQLADAH